MNFGKRLRTLILVTSLLIGGSGVVDLVDDTSKDIVSIENTITNPNKQTNNIDTSDGIQGAAKGAVCLISLILLYTSQNNKDTVKIPVPVSVTLPHNLKINQQAKNLSNYRDHEMSHYFQRESDKFIRLLRKSIPSYLLEVCDIEEIKITIERDTIVFDVFLNVVQIKGHEDLVKVIIKAVKKFCEDLFKEKMERIGREMVNYSFPEVITKVVDMQLEEMNA
jgi:hypothetical protein